MHSVVPDIHLPRTLNCQLLRPVEPGDAQTVVSVHHQGKHGSYVSGEIRQHGRLVAHGTSSLGTVFHGPTEAAPKTPEAGVPQDWAVEDEDPSPWLGIERRPVPITDGRGAWLRISRKPSILAWPAVVLADSMLPLVSHWQGQSVVAPTVELTAHFAVPIGRDVSPWLFGVFRNRHCGGGWAVEDCELFSVRGELVVSTRQTRRVFPSENRTDK
jgi:acyl-CoA thioesterase